MNDAGRARAAGPVPGARQSVKAWLKRTIPEHLGIHLQAVDRYFYGESEIRLLRGLCNPKKYAVDIGANIGIYSYFLRRYSSRVVAYEPHPALAARLQRIFGRDVTVRPIGLHEHDGWLTLRVPIRSGVHVHELGSVSQSFDDEADIEKHEVEIRCLDSDIAENMPIGFIKIDVEQSELPVLRGALCTIQKHRPNIMTEVTPLLYDKTIPETFDFITKLDYDGYFQYDGCVMPFCDFNEALHANKKSYGRSFMNNNIFLLPHEADPQRIFGRRYRS